MSIGAELRVLTLTPDFPPAPGGIQILAHRIALHARRTQMRVVTLSSPGASRLPDAEPFQVRRVRATGRARHASILLLNGRAVREAFAYRPDAVLSAHIVVSPSASAIRCLFGARVVQYLHADEARARPRLARFAVRKADAVIAVSRHTRDLALAAGADPAKVHVIPPGVDLPDATTGDRDGAPPTLVTVARLEDRYKGHDVVMQALRLIRDRIPAVQWIVVGDGSLRGDLEQLAVAAGVQGNVRFVGAVSDSERDAWLDRADVFLMPSRLPDGGSGGEGFGIVYLEAAAHGLPVVAGDAGGARDAVVHGETGLLVDPADPVAVAEAVTGLLHNSARAKAMGRRAATRAREFAWPRIAERVEKVLFQVTGDSA